MSNRRSPSGQLLPIIDNKYDENPIVTILDGQTLALVRKVMQYQILKGALFVGATLLLPPNPKSGDEVIIVSSLITFVLGIAITINGNGKNIGITGPSIQTTSFSWLKFNINEDVWIRHDCCGVGLA